MYVFGGYEEIIERFGQDVYCLDLSSYSWKLVVSIVHPPPLMAIVQMLCHSTVLESLLCTGTSTQPLLLVSS
jgi:hypothetical protein